MKIKNLVDHPEHYTSPIPGIEVIEITKHMNFCLGNVIKYVLRCDHKGTPIEDLRKAIKYLQFEIERREGENTGTDNSTVGEQEDTTQKPCPACRKASVPLYDGTAIAYFRCDDCGIFFG